jgi:hypothetical protein
MGTIRRPAELRNASLPELRRFVKHDLDNLDRVHRRIQILEINDCQHGVEKIIDPTWQTLPLVIPGGQATSGFRIESVTWRLIDETAGARSQLGVTVYYAPPYGRVDLRRTAAQTIANNSNTALQWTTQTTAVGALSHSTSSNPDRITCTADGIVLVTSSIPFDTSAAGIRQGFLSPDSGSTTYLHGPITPAGYTPIVLNAQIAVTAGQILRAYVYQNSGGNLDVLSGSFLQARYVGPPASAAADVSLLLICD